MFSLWLSVDSEVRALQQAAGVAQQYVGIISGLVENQTATIRGSVDGVNVGTSDTINQVTEFNYRSGHQDYKLLVS